MIPPTQYTTLDWPGLDKQGGRKTYADMVKLESVNIPSILHNIRERFKRDLFMTNIGDILVLVNPYKWIDSYYTMNVVASFANAPLDGGDDENNEDPHIFGIAAAAYRGITLAQRQNAKRSKGQAIIISGESGSGKTEATKKCLQYLTAVADGTVQTYLMQNGHVGVSGSTLSALIRAQLTETTICLPPHPRATPYVKRSISGLRVMSRTTSHKRFYLLTPS